MDFIDYDQDLPEEEQPGTTQEWDQEEEGKEHLVEEEVPVYPDIDHGAGQEDQETYPCPDASLNSGDSERRMRIFGQGAPRLTENPGSHPSFKGFGKCVCGCGSFVGPGHTCRACGHSYDAHAR